MDIFIKYTAGVLVTLILVQALGSRGKDIGILLMMAVCCMCAAAAFRLFQPVIEFLETLVDVGSLDDSLVLILLKAAGIGLVTEVAALICADSGSASLGKTLQFLGNGVILWLSLPLFTMMLELIRTILGDL